MGLRGIFEKRSFAFVFDARTSRGRMTERTSWLVRVFDPADPQTSGLGECGPLPGLSRDDVSRMDVVLAEVMRSLEDHDNVGVEEVCPLVRSLVPSDFPAVVFGLETSLLDLAHGGKRVVFANDFVKGRPIPINGLVWMGDRRFMMDQVISKVEAGYRCIKIKVGGLDFREECEMLADIRATYQEKKLELRLDANGAFPVDEVMGKLTALAQFDIHSIEQPIRAGDAFLPELCRHSPIPVALDEELIGREQDKHALLARCAPAYIILKPGIHGGFLHCREWIALAEELKIGWWVTSALESSIGLNAICQFTAAYEPVLPQGLGTGSLYSNNFPSPLVAAAGTIRYDPLASWRTEPWA